MTITIDEAIEGLEGEVREAEDEGALEAVEYLNLGIEALCAIRNERRGIPIPKWRLLPGETE